MALTWAEYGAAIDEQGIPVSDYIEQGQAYWHGRLSLNPHQWGYTNWDSTDYARTDYGTFFEESDARRIADETLDARHVHYFEDLASALAGRFNINNTFVEVGCGPGALVYYARTVLGVEAYGVEVSQYAVDYGETIYPGVSTWITVQDAYSYLVGQKRNAIDVLVSRGFLPCLDDTGTDVTEKQVVNFVTEANRVAKVQAHMILPVPVEAYIVKTIEQWRDDFDWAVGTYFINGNTLDWVRK